MGHLLHIFFKSLAFIVPLPKSIIVMPGAVDGYSSSIVYKLASLRYIFCIRCDYLRDQTSAGSLFKELMFWTHYAFLPAFLRFVQNVWKAFSGIFFLVYSACMNFFHLIFPCMNFFGTSPPPHNFSYGSSLSTFSNIFGEPGGGQLGQEKRRRKFSLRTGRRAPGMLLLTNKFHDSFECFSVIGHTK